MEIEQVHEVAIALNRMARICNTLLAMAPPSEDTLKIEKQMYELYKSTPDQPITNENID